MKLAAIFTALLLAVPAKEKLIKTKVGEDVTVNLPQSFMAMTPEDLAQRYPSVRKPIGAFTNQDRVVDFSVNISATRWRSSDIEIAKEFFKASILELYDRTDIISEGIKTIDDKAYIYFEFDSRVNGDKYSLDQQDAIRKYTYIQYLLINGKTIVFSFNAPQRDKAYWKELVPEIMNSVNVKNSI